MTLHHFRGPPLSAPSSEGPAFKWVGKGVIFFFPHKEWVLIWLTNHPQQYPLNKPLPQAMALLKAKWLVGGVGNVITKNYNDLWDHSYISLWCIIISCRSAQLKWRELQKVCRSALPIGTPLTNTSEVSHYLLHLNVFILCHFKPVKRLCFKWVSINTDVPIITEQSKQLASDLNIHCALMFCLARLIHFCPCPQYCLVYFCHAGRCEQTLRI